MAAVRPLAGFAGAGLRAGLNPLRGIAGQRERWILWLPPALGLGIALYFALPEEPARWVAAAPAALIVPAVILRRHAVAPVFLVLVAAGLGFAAAEVRTALVAAPVLDSRLGPVTVEGLIEAASLNEKGGWRVRLVAPVISRLEPAATPRRIRIAIRRADGDPAPGKRLRLLAILQPPPEPASPGAFDFARRAYFRQIGAVGFALGTARVLPGPAAPGLRTRMNRVRHAVTGRILAALPAPENAIAAALTTGERRAIPAEVMAAIRDAGLAHLLAISGLHFALVAGLLFGGLRAAMASLPAVALRYPIKKWAAFGAFIGAFGYLLISGASIPTQRAFMMLGIVLLAVMLDRAAISMRLVAVAAGAILLSAPESLLSASFQLSFAAVVALVAFYEANARRLAGLRSDAGMARRVMLYGAGIALTTLIAGLATAPFAVYHFNRFAVYGVIANLIAIPITGMWIMPWAIGAFALMPFGLEALALAPMGWGIGAVVWVARTVASWPDAVLMVAAVPVACLVLVALGGLWLALWRGRLRLAGLVPLLAAVPLALIERPPNILLGRTPQAFAVRLAGGGLAVSPGTRGYTRKLWLRRAGLDRAAPWPRPGGPVSAELACDRLGCIHIRARPPDRPPDRPGGRRPVVAFVADRAALAEDCGRAAVVLAAVAVKARRCRGPDLIIDRWARYRGGAHALWLHERGARVRTVAQVRGLRPWTARYRRLNTAGKAPPAGPAP